MHMVIKGKLYPHSSVVQALAAPCLALGISLTLAVASPAFAQVVDGFETGAEVSDIPDWEELGPSGTIDGSHGFATWEGSFMAFLSGEQVAHPSDPFAAPVPPSTVESALGLPSGAIHDAQPISPNFGSQLPVYDGAAMYRTFQVNAGDTVSFQWQFLHRADPLNPFSVFERNDYAYVFLDQDDVMHIADSFSSALSATSDLLGPAVVIPPHPFFGGGGTYDTIESTGWQPFSYTFPNSGTVTLGVGVADSDANGPFSYGPGILIDDFQTTASDPTNGDPNTAPTCVLDTSAADADFLQLGDGSWVVSENQTFMVAFLGSDADGDMLTASVTTTSAAGTFPGLPGGAMAMDLSGPQPLTSVFSWTPMDLDKADAPYTISVTFTDLDGASSPPCDLVISDINLNPSCSIAGSTVIDGMDVITVECTDPTGDSVTLVASASDDDDPVSSLSYLWDLSDMAVMLDDATSLTPTGPYTFGDTTATLTVTDGRGGVGFCDVIVRVQDTVPPDIGLTTDCAGLWPPNHKMVTVQLVIPVSDTCTDPSAIQLTSLTIRSDEPDDSTGDGRFVGDVGGLDGYAMPQDFVTTMAFDASQNAFVGAVQLRAERSGNGDGRKYTIDVSADDASGNTAYASCCVIVPHNQKGK